MAEYSNPFVRGFLGAQQSARQADAQNIQNLGGLLTLQNAAEMRPLQQEQLRIAVANAKQNQALKQAIFGGMGGVPAAVPSGGTEQSATGSPIPNAQTQSQGMLGGLSPQAAMLLLSGDTGMGALGKAMLEQGKPINVRPGGTVYVPGQGPQYTAPGTNGSQITYGLNGNPSVGVLPGAVESQTALGATPLEKVQNPDQTFSYVPRARLATAGGAPSGAPIAVPSQLQGRPQAEIDAIRRAQSIEASGGVANERVPAPQGGPSAIGTIPSAAVTPGFGGAPKFGQTQEEQIRQAGLTGSNVEAGKEFVKKQADNYEKLRDVPATIANMDRARQLASSQAQQFMGPLGESKLAITKFMRSNLPGMANLNTEGVTNAEQLQSTLFNQVMDNLKKMDASPSQYQQQVMQEAFGTLRTDPQSVPKIIDVFEDILRNRVDIHNQTVKSAEGRGTVFPYDISVNLPAAKRRSADRAIQETRGQAPKSGGVKFLGFE